MVPCARSRGRGLHGSQPACHYWLCSQSPVPLLICEAWLSPSHPAAAFTSRPQCSWLSSSPLTPVYTMLIISRCFTPFSRVLRLKLELGRQPKSPGDPIFCLQPYPAGVTGLCINTQALYMGPADPVPSPCLSSSECCCLFTELPPMPQMFSKMPFN